MSNCFGPFTFFSNEVETKIINLEITKETCPYVMKGQDICYAVTAANNSDVDLSDLLFSDKLAKNLTYIAGTFEVDGVFVVPMIADNIIQYPISVSANGGHVVIKFCVKVN